MCIRDSISKATVLPTSVDEISDNFLSPGFPPPKPSNSASCAESDATDHVTTTDNVDQCCADDNNSVN